MKTNMAALKKKKTKKKNSKKKKISSKKKSVKFRKKVIKKKKGGIILKRAYHNPIIEPRSYIWESKATLNPAAFIANGKVHLVYRAIGDNDSSVLGYAGSQDGYNIDDRPTYAIYQRPNNFNRPDLSVSSIDYISGGGWNGGCEDPRVTLLGDIVYMLYTAFDGWGSVRITLT